MKFEVIDDRVSRLGEWVVQRFDEWWLERKIRLANEQVRLAEEATSSSLQAAAQWRDYSAKLQDVRRVKGFRDKGNDWKPSVDWVTISVLALTCAIAGCAVALAVS